MAFFLRNEVKAHKEEYKFEEYNPRTKTRQNKSTKDLKREITDSDFDAHTGGPEQQEIEVDINDFEQQEPSATGLGKAYD